MTIATVQSVVRKFIASANPEVLVLKGPWGVGKTHAWKMLVETFKDESNLHDYSYVSLFGIGSLAELRLAIYVKTRSVKTLGQPMTVASVNENWLDYAKSGTKALRQFASRGKDIPIIKNITVGFDAVAPHLISGTLVCLDDFERLSGRLSPEELLGFISYLKEEKNCKVVLIFNEQRLGEKADVYVKYREKLIDIEVLYLPLPADSAAIAFGRGMPWTKRITDRAITLGITNIRLLRKIDRITQMTWPLLQGMHDLVLRQAIDSIVLLSWCYYEQDDKKPSLAFLRKFDSMGFAMAKHALAKKDEKPDPREEEWEKLLDLYEFRRMDEFDLALLKAVEQGYIEETRLDVEAKKLDGFFKAADAESSFTKAWALFHDTFANNEDELVVALRDSFKKSVNHISPINLNGTVKLLRDVGRNAIADEIVEYYIDTRSADKDLFDLGSYAFAGEVTDAVLRARFAEKFTKDNPVPPLPVAATNISKGSWSGADECALGAATEDDLYALFKQDHGVDLNRIVKGVLRLGANAKHEELGRRAKAALERIAAESKVNAIRVDRYLK